MNELKRTILMVLGGAVAGVIVGFLIFWYAHQIYNYRIDFALDRYFCNEYQLKDDQLILKDCLFSDKTIHRPTNFIIIDNNKEK